MTVVLIAEDHESNRRVLSRRLARQGYDVLEAANGAEAVAMVQEHAPDVILMDISMPVLDGLEAWRMIEQMCEKPPVAIALTATAIRDVQLACHDAGFSDYITKPVDFRRLCETIDMFSAIAAEPQLA